MKEKTQDPKGKDTLAIHIREDRMKAAMESTGNIIPFINTFRDLSNSEKADFYDDLTIRKKGTPPKINPWR